MAGHVYLIGSRQFKWYKIGKSSNATIRISDLGILLPFKIEILAVWKSENYHQLERDLHKKYEEHHINGEWFAFSNEQINNILYEMAHLSSGIAIPKFSNISQNTQMSLHRKLSPKYQKRIDKLVLRNAQLEEIIRRYGYDRIAADEGGKEIPVV